MISGSSGLFLTCSLSLSFDKTCILFTKIVVMDKSKRAPTEPFCLVIEQRSPQISAKNRLKTSLKRTQNVRFTAQIFFSRRQGKYYLGRSSRLMR